MKITFFGTPELSVPFLESLYDDKFFNIIQVITQPDKPVGRKQVLTPSPVKIFAQENDLPVIHDFNSLKKTDYFVIIAYGKIIPQNILDISKFGSINVHPSKLPKWRGPSPLQAAIKNGDTKTAVSIMLIDDKMDHGPILAQQDIFLSNTETPETLSKKVIQIGVPLLKQSLKDYSKNKLIPIPQDDSNSTFCKLLKKESGKIDWNSPAQSIERMVRAYTPWPGTWTAISSKNNNHSKKIKIHSVKNNTSLKIDIKLSPGTMQVIENKLLVGTKTNPIEILELQLEGKKKISAKDFINGNKKKISLG